MGRKKQDKLGELHCVRNTLELKLDAFKNHVESVKKTFDENNTLDNLTITELKVRHERVKSVFDKFDTIQDELESLCDNASIEFETRKAIENKYWSSLANSQLLIDTYSVRSNSSPPTATHMNHSLTDQQSKVQSVKLPIIDLPKFNGNYDNWLEYRDTFLSVIHKNNSLDNVIKFQYLKSSLVGEAAKVVSLLDTSSNNYEEAWRLLCERYNKTRLLVNNHVKALFSLSKIESESAKSIRSVVNETTQHLRALKILEQPVDQWDVFLVHLITSKLDGVTARDWETTIKDDEMPTAKKLFEFLSSKADTLENLTVQSNQNRTKSFSSHYNSDKRKSFENSRKTNVYLSTNNLKCSYCTGAHSIATCSDLLKQSVTNRLEQIKAKALCINCLRSGHFIRDCKASNCKKCNLKHHTILHIDREGKDKQELRSNSQTDSNVTSLIHIDNDNSEEKSLLESGNQVLYNRSKTATQILLATALVNVIDSRGRSHECRILLDSGSQSNLITKEFCKRIGLSKRPIHVSISGVGTVKSAINEKATVSFRSRNANYEKEISCLVTQNICDELPNHKFRTNDIPIPVHIQLADPEFNVPRKIDMLLGAEIFWQVLETEQIKLGVALPILHKTKFGWILTGPLPIIPQNVYCNFSKIHDTDTVEIRDLLSKFWTLEEVSFEPAQSAEEIECEKHFTNTHTRDAIGRFVVSIPLKDSTEKLGDSKDKALNRFYSLEKKLLRNLKLRTMYNEFMQEYLDLNHMCEVTNVEKHGSYYMPHHGVLNEEHTTTKLRVVFNASATTSTGVSFNDLQMVGPSLQNDLFSILIRFREHLYVASADITKMYRQIKVDRNQRSLQRIVWRFNPSEPVREFELNTVTYGTASAPFLAIRCLYQLGVENVESHADASNAIKNDFYVDDLLTGADDPHELSKTCKTISDILKSSCMELRKWKTNDKLVLSELNVEINNNTMKFGQNEGTKTLGVYWSCDTDMITYKINNESESKQVTKRILLSKIAQIFDPLGLLGCCTIIAKIILQLLWLENLSWDDVIPDPLSQRWNQFYSELSKLNTIKVPRCITINKAEKKQIHIFCDASKEAYGACAYLRSENREQTTCHLICAKSKIAPLKPVSIPRLELCAAVVAARLLMSILKSLNTEYECILWSDSSIVLAWIKTSPNLLKPFVSNRIAEVQTSTVNFEWRHVPTKDNPADLISRGVLPSAIADCTLWWHGPPWLVNNPEMWPNRTFNRPHEIPEMKTKNTILVNTNSGSCNLIERFSTFNRMKRVLAYCRRFKSNCQARPASRTYGPLSVTELEDTLNCIVRYVQSEMFVTEYKCLKNNKSISNNSKLLGLNPFIDDNDIIRVGGRLGRSQFTFNKKHPIILTSKHHFTKLLVKNEHIRLLHAGPQQTLYSIRENFWPISARNLVREIVRNCVTCFKVKPRNITPLMGNLPPSRIQQMHPFQICGVDYGGPLFIKDKKGRGSRQVKSYICLFVCFVTKAVHIELVSDLSKNTFIAAFRRFTSRRGIPTEMNSDNGTNFVGANNELRELGEFIIDNKTTLETYFNSEGVRWKFIPAHSPHMGGLWEAGIRSAKYHIKRISGNASLTYEELSTLLVQIEAVLNSRPLTQLSTDPSDPIPLTPSHFLIGRPLTTLADPDVTHISENRLSTFQRIQQLKQHFWTRWAKEYISELQQRARWKTSSGSLQPGTIVLIKEDNVPPLCWSLGVVESLHPGSDNIARVATIRTSKGLFKRAVVKLCPLPDGDMVSRVL